MSARDHAWYWSLNTCIFPLQVLLIVVLWRYMLLQYLFTLTVKIVMLWYNLSHVLVEMFHKYFSEKGQCSTFNTKGLCFEDRNGWLLCFCAKMIFALLAPPSFSSVNLVLSKNPSLQRNSFAFYCWLIDIKIICFSSCRWNFNLVVHVLFCNLASTKCETKNESKPICWGQKSRKIDCEQKVRIWKKGSSNTV